MDGSSVHLNCTGHARSVLQSLTAQVFQLLRAGGHGDDAHKLLEDAAAARLVGSYPPLSAYQKGDPSIPRFKILIELEPTWAWNHVDARRAAERAASAIEELRVDAPAVKDRPLLEVERVLVQRVGEPGE